jgi:dienelactone hydrolase
MKIIAVLTTFLMPFASLAYPVVFESTPFLGSGLIRPNRPDKSTMILMLHGSEGGSRRSLSGEANILAVLGYGVLTFCYFDCRRGLTGPRETLKDVELGGLQAAVRWLRQHPAGDGRVLIYGFSRGAELALILGSLVSTIDTRPSAIIAHSPSDTFNGVYNWDWREPACWLCQAGEGRCSATSGPSEFKWNPRCDPDNDPALMDFGVSAWLLNGNAVPIRTPIPIETYDGPILMTVGTDDSVWPYEQTARLEEKLKRAGRTPEVAYFQGADHAFSGDDEIKRRDMVLDFLRRLP